MSSKSWSFRTAKLIADKEVASVVVRLMMGLNDLAMANEGLKEWTIPQERRKLARQSGGRLYYDRMLMAHVYEALNIIKDIQNSRNLQVIVQGCDPATRASFDPATRASFNDVAICLKSDDYRSRLRRGPNVAIEYRWDQTDRSTVLVADLLRRQVAVTMRKLT